MKKSFYSNKKFKSLPEIKNFAKKKISNKKWNWLENGTERELTLQENLNSFKNIKLVPRVLGTKNKSFAKYNFLGKKIPFPLIISPMGHLTQFHTNGEAELALGAEKSNTFITISSYTRINLEEIRNYTKKANIIYQLFFNKNKAWVSNEINQALKIKSLAIVITVDSPARAYKYRTMIDKYDARKHGRRTNFNRPENSEPYFTNWKDIAWLKKRMKNIPLILKGVLHPDDAVKAFKYGAQGVWVSNHGGRAFESCVSSLEMLPKIRKKIGKNKLIIFDSGIRTGSDIVKACYFGANIVGIGRPAIYGLIANGCQGVKNTFDLFKREYFSSKILSGS